MWDSVSAVDQDHDPIIYEGKEPVVVIVMNAGPSSVIIQAWYKTDPPYGSEPFARLELRAGNIKAINGSLIRAKLVPSTIRGPRRSDYAALGWTVRL